MRMEHNNKLRRYEQYYMYQCDGRTGIRTEKGKTICPLPISWRRHIKSSDFDVLSFFSFNPNT